jgi:hypothetical protein
MLTSLPKYSLIRVNRNRFCLLSFPVITMCLAMSHLYAALPMSLVQAWSSSPPMADGSVLDCHFKLSIHLRQTCSWVQIGLQHVSLILLMVVSVDCRRRAWTVCQQVRDLGLMVIVHLQIYCLQMVLCEIYYWTWWVYTPMRKMN